jgi:NAD(P)-dependent dehydrogenase (short-subunit alcohol dehydrogenase family)
VTIDNTPLQGRTALVTGSSRGIGRAIALKLGSLGADVAVNYVTNTTCAAEVVSQLRAMNRRAFAAQADVSNLAQLSDLFARVAKEWGTLDVFVNNAIDVASYGPTMKLRPDGWRHTIDSHVTPLLVGAQLAMRLMKGRAGASIVAISSLGARTCLDGYAPIGVGKAAVEALTRYLAMDLGSEGVRVNAVSAGPIDTDGLRRLRAFEQLEAISVDHAPGRRMGTPADVADVVGFLCSDDARWIHGQTLIVDGGFSLLGATA